MEPQNQVTPPVSQVNQALSKVASKKMWPYIAAALLVILAGIGGAWGISRLFVKGISGGAPGIKVSSTEAGALDPKVKYDTAEGILQEGGIGNEGTFHLVREGGPSKYVYLTSSVVDLRNFLDKKVDVWGETLASKKAGWLMDVAKVKVAE
jgi:hypothetical protein